MGKSLQGGRLVSNSRIFVDSGGNIGIGSTQPTSKLDITGDVKITGISTLSNVTVGGATFSGNTNFNSTVKIASGSAAAPGLYVGPSTNSSTGIYSPGSNQFGIATGGTAALTIDFAQRVGIGTISPNHKLHINSSGASNTFTQYTNSTTGSGSGDGSLIGVTSAGELLISQKESNAISFHTSNTERLQIDSSGHFGFNVGTGNGYTVQFNDTSSCTLQLTNDTIGSGSGDGSRITASTSGILYIENQESSDIVFSTGGTEKLRITSAGQLQATGAADVRLTLGSGGTAGTNDSVHMRADGADLKFMAANGGNTIFETNGTETLRITSAGLLLGGSDSEYNTTLGDNAGDNFTGTALYNTLIGQDAGTAMTTADTNTAVGAYALATATTASMSCAFGYAALRNTDAWYNNAFGKDALENCTSGSGNNAFGYVAMESHTTGNNNCAFGHEALMSNTTSWSNSAFGAHALRSNTGASNTAVGRNAMYTNTSGYQNASVGRDSLYDNTSGINNAALGYRSLRKNTTGKDNVCIGRDSGYFNTTGSGNISIGICNSSGNYAPVFGLGTSNNRVVMGSTAVTNAYVQVAWTVVSDARDKMNFGTVPHGLEFIKQLNPVSFQFKFARDSDTPNGPVRYGFKAQDILALEGEDNSVIIDNDDPDKLRYNGEALVPVLVNAIKEQQTIIDTLIARLDAAGI